MGFEETIREAERRDDPGRSARPARVKAPRSVPMTGLRYRPVWCGKPGGCPGRLPTYMLGGPGTLPGTFDLDGWRLEAGIWTWALGPGGRRARRGGAAAVDGAGNVLVAGPKDWRRLEGADAFGARRPELPAYFRCPLPGCGRVSVVIAEMVVQAGSEPV